MSSASRTVTARAYARVGLIGNPSDGYYGKTIAVAVRNFHAEVRLEPSRELVIAPHPSDSPGFGSLEELADRTRRLGYYGGLRLMLAAISVFWRYCRSHGIPCDAGNFRLSYSSDIPRSVGLAGSSALVTACLKALMAYYGAAIPFPLLANLALAAERDELGIAAGLQDRVVQAYEGAVYMDFGRQLMDRQGYGDYRPIAPQRLPPLYLAYDYACAEGSERSHGTLRARFDAGEAEVVEAMGRLAELTERAYALLQDGRPFELKPLMNEAFDLRRSICAIPPAQLRMVETARATGASSQFAGSGGAIVGIYDDQAMYRRLQGDLAAIGCTVLQPVVG